MTKNLILGMILARFWTKGGPQNLFRGFYLYLILYIVASYHCMLFQGKLMNQTWQNGKKTGFRPIFGPSGPNSGRQFFFFFKNLASLVTSYHG